MSYIKPGPSCGYTNPSTLATPGPTGYQDASDPDHPLPIPDSSTPLGSLFEPGRIVLAQAGGMVNIPGEKTGPWQRIPDTVFSVGDIDFPLFKYSFATSTSLAKALEWILDNSLYTANTLFKPKFIEVSLIWFLKKKCFVAYTAKVNHATTYNARVRSKEMIFVAHVHPTKLERQSTTTSERTTVASQKDLKSLNDKFSHHQYSIIMHRDVSDNKTPCGFIYDFKHQGKQVMAKKGRGAFTAIANQYMKLEPKVGKNT